jgi:hypothetical protein
VIANPLLNFQCRFSLAASGDGSSIVRDLENVPLITKRYQLDGKTTQEKNDAIEKDLFCDAVLA